MGVDIPIRFALYFQIMENNKQPVPKEVSNYFADLGRKGGSAKSDRKLNACRANGAKGGRPRKDIPPQDQ